MFKIKITLESLMLKIKVKSE